VSWWLVRFVDGQQQIYHSPTYTVMTNDPPFDEQLRLADQWRDKDPFKE
jgi:penicillin V acylase-like amidase (Ntn superfamily)